jgi:tight adherence protein B
LSRGVQAGESLEQALQLVGDHVERPLAYEFQYCHRHLEMGLSVEATMRALTRRVPIVEIQILASTLVVQRRTGGDLPGALESLARVIRDRLNYYRQFRAATAASRVSFVVMSLAGPVLAVSMWTWRKEAVEEFLASSEGQKLTALASGLYVIGVAWIFQLLRPRY